MSTRCLLLTMVAAVGIIASAPAHAVLFQVSAAGTIADQIRDTSLAAIGDSYSLDLTIDVSGGTISSVTGSGTFAGHAFTLTNYGRNVAATVPFGTHETFLGPAFGEGPGGFNFDYLQLSFLAPSLNDPFAALSTVLQASDPTLTSVRFVFVQPLSNGALAASYGGSLTTWSVTKVAPNTTVAEPATLMMLVAGGIGLMTAGRRRLRELAS